MPGCWYCSCSCLQHIWTASQTAQCSQHVFHVKEPERAGSSATTTSSALRPQKSPVAPRDGLNLTLKPSRQHLTEEKQRLTQHNTAAVLAPVPLPGPFWLSPFTGGPEEEEWQVTQQPRAPGTTGDLQLSSVGQLCPGLEERRGAVPSLRGALPALPSQQAGEKKNIFSGKTESGRNSGCKNHINR